MSERIEWRARVRRPAHLLDSAEDMERGHVHYWTNPFPTREEARQAGNHRYEEELSAVVGYQKRRVVMEEWEDYTEPAPPKEPEPKHIKVSIYGGSEYLCATCPPNSYGYQPAWSQAHPDLP